MIEILALILGVILCGTLIAWALNARGEAGELDRMRRFQEAMRAGGREHPLPHKRED